MLGGGQPQMGVEIYNGQRSGIVKVNMLCCFMSGAPPWPDFYCVSDRNIYTLYKSDLHKDTHTESVGILLLWR